MGDTTKIEWSSHTFNPWRGCTKVSPGCVHCYAEAGSKQNPSVLGIWGDHGVRQVAVESYWDKPRKWNNKAKAAGISSAHQDPTPGIRPRVFCASLADVFEDFHGRVRRAGGGTLGVCEYCHRWFRDPLIDDDLGAACPHCETNSVELLTLDDVRRRLFDVIYQTPHLDWLLLTKRPQNIKGMIEAALDTKNDSEPHILDLEPFEKLYPNVWLGTSVEDQKRADERIPELLKVPAALRFLSMEPLLGPVDLTEYYFWRCPVCGKSGTHEWSQCAEHGDMIFGSGIGWSIAGGESGHNARRCDIQWIRDIRDQCQSADVPVFVKQLGSQPYSELEVELSRTKAYGGTGDSKGGDPEEWPEDLRVREIPGAKLTA